MSLGEAATLVRHSIRPLSIANGGPLAEERLTMTPDVHQLPAMMVLAWQDPIFLQPFIGYYGADGNPGVEDYLHSEQHVLNADDPSYCPVGDCVEAPADDPCPTEGMSEEAIAAFDSFAQTRQAYCNAHAATPDRVCVDIWIQKCEILVGTLAGDCPTGTEARDRNRLRVRFVLDVVNGTLHDYQVSPTCTTTGTCWPPAATNVVGSHRILGGVLVHGSLINSHPFWGAGGYSPLGRIEFDMFMKKEGDGFSVHAATTPFPSFAVFPGRNGYWGPGKVMGEHGSEIAILAGAVRHCTFTIR